MLDLVRAIHPPDALEPERRRGGEGHADRSIILSLFRGPHSVVTAAELLAEIGDPRERHASSPPSKRLPAKPPHRQSGKTKVARFRSACKNLRTAVSVLADASAHHNRRAYDIDQAPAPKATTTPTHAASSATPGSTSSGARRKAINPAAAPNHDSLSRLVAAEG